MYRSIEVWLSYLPIVFFGGSEVVFMCGCLWAVEHGDLHIEHYNYYLDDEGSCLAFALSFLGAELLFGGFHFFLKGVSPSWFGKVLDHIFCERDVIWDV